MSVESKIRTHIQFIADMFRMRTGIKAERVFQIGFERYMIEAEDGKTYSFVG